MAKAKKIAISITKDTLEELDRLVEKKLFSNRSQAIESAVKEKILQITKSRLATEASKLQKKEEQALADEGLEEDFSEWPEY